MGFNAPIYLVSVPRSGATLLAAMLNSHKNIAMFNEAWFFQMLPKYGTFRRRRNAEMLLDDLCAAAKRFGILLDPQFKKEVLGELYQFKFPGPMDALSIFLRNYAGNKRKARWGVKQPFGIFDVPRLLVHFPDLKVIHIIRDPRATAAHRMGKEINGGENLSDSFSFSRSSSKMISYADRVISVIPENYLALKYEDLVQNPPLWLMRICEFLGEEYDPYMLEYHKSSNLYVPRETDGYPRHTHKDVLLPVHTKGVDAWKKLLTWREIAIVERICHREMVKYGYLPLTSEREISAVLFVLAAVRFRWRLARKFLRREFFGKMFHTFRKAFIFLFSRYVIKKT